MLRTTLFVISLLGLLATAAVVAHAEPTSPTWRGWGYHRHRPVQGDFVPVYATYPYHSRERHGLFGFFAQKQPHCPAHGQGQAASSLPGGLRLALAHHRAVLALCSSRHPAPSLFRTSGYEKPTS